MTSFFTRQTDPRRTEIDQLQRSVRELLLVQDTAPDEIRWRWCDELIVSKLRRIAELNYVQEWEIDEEVELVRHQFRGQGL